MKNRLMRPSSALFPLALLAADAIVPGDTAARLLLCYFVQQLFSLCAVDAFRNAAAREPGLRRVDKRFWGAFPMLLLALALSALLCIRISDGEFVKSICFAAVPWLILIEQLFEERLFTLNRSADGSILSLISNVLLFVGLALDGTNGLPSPFAMFYPLAAAAMGALIAAFTSLKFAPPKGFSLVPRNIPFAPRAMLQALLCPVAMIAVHVLVGWQTRGAWAFLPCWLLWRLCRTTCRRSGDESRSLALLLAAVTAAAVAASDFLAAVTVPAFCCLLVFACAMAVYLTPSLRSIAGFLLPAAAFACIQMQIPHASYIAVACGLIAVILNLKNAFLRKI